MLLNFIAIVLAMTGILNPVIGALVRKPALVDLPIARLCRKSAAVAS